MSWATRGTTRCALTTQTTQANAPTLSLMNDFLSIKNVGVALKKANCRPANCRTRGAAAGAAHGEAHTSIRCAVECPRGHARTHARTHARRHASDIAPRMHYGGVWCGILVQEREKGVMAHGYATRHIAVCRPGGAQPHSARKLTPVPRPPGHPGPAACAKCTARL